MQRIGGKLDDWDWAISYDLPARRVLAQLGHPLHVVRAANAPLTVLQWHCGCSGLQSDEARCTVQWCTVHR
jgi:hypothetical protein